MAGGQGGGAVPVDDEGHSMISPQHGANMCVITHWRTLQSR